MRLKPSHRLAFLTILAVLAAGRAACAAAPVYVEVVPSRETVLVNEPFTVSLAIQIPRLPDPHADAEPLDAFDPPWLDIPFLDPTPVKGLERPDLKPLFQGRLLPEGEPGFAIHHFEVSNNPFDVVSTSEPPVLTRNRKARFRFDRRTVTRSEGAFNEYSLQVRYVARVEGQYAFGPVIMKGRVLRAVDKAGKPTTEKVSVVSKAATVSVIPPPLLGRPASYTGAIGHQLAVHARLNTRRCTVGDPVQLTIAVTGDISPQNMAPPTLSRNAALRSVFRVYDDAATRTTPDGERQYVYTIRPNRAGTVDVPPLDVAYYDLGERAYRTVSTRPLPLRVSPARVTAADGAEFLLPIAPLDVSPGGHVPVRLRPGLPHLVVLLVAPLLYLLCRFGLRPVLARPFRHEWRNGGKSEPPKYPSTQ